MYLVCFGLEMQSNKKQWIVLAECTQCPATQLITPTSCTEIFQLTKTIKCEAHVSGRLLLIRSEHNKWNVNVHFLLHYVTPLPSIPSKFCIEKGAKLCIAVQFSWDILKSPLNYQI